MNHTINLFCLAGYRFGLKVSEGYLMRLNLHFKHSFYLLNES